MRKELGVSLVRMEDDGSPTLTGHAARTCRCTPLNFRYSGELVWICFIFYTAVVFKVSILKEWHHTIASLAATTFFSHTSGFHVMLSKLHFIGHHQAVGS